MKSIITPVKERQGERTYENFSGQGGRSIQVSVV